MGHYFDCYCSGCKSTFGAAVKCSMNTELSPGYCENGDGLIEFMVKHIFSCGGDWHEFKFIHELAQDFDPYEKWINDRPERGE